MKILLLGYGKMGKEIEQIAISRKHEVVLKVDETNAATVSIADFKKADVAIEFSTPENAVPNIYKCFEAEIPIVVGTTGWLNNLKEVEQKCKYGNHTLFYASNFSIGVNIFFKVNTYLAKIMNAYSNYEVSLEEIHHIHKLDSPSGTGISLANQVLEQISRKTKWVEGISEKENELSIISKRENEIPGTHMIYYRSEVDDIEIKHTAHNRKGFALGAVMAAEFVQNKKGIYGMNDMLSI